jgi:hypothetical protein
MNFIQIKNDITLRLVKKNACKDAILEIAALTPSKKPFLQITTYGSRSQGVADSFGNNQNMARTNANSSLKYSSIALKFWYP